MQRYAGIALTSLQEALLFNAAGGAIALGALFFFRVPLSDSFGFIILIESTGLMLVGGALSLAGQATTRKVAEMFTRQKVTDSEVSKSDLKAGLYALTGAMLFIEVFGLFLLLS